MRNASHGVLICAMLGSVASFSLVDINILITSGNLLRLRGVVRRSMLASLRATRRDGCGSNLTVFGSGHRHSFAPGPTSSDNRPHTSSHALI